MNTCGRICVHKSGRFVVVSNRGHQSIAVYRVRSQGPKRGELRIVGYFHTRGETPRHFQFDNSGQYLLVANQDTDTIAVFNFNLSNGDLKYSGNEYRVPSPNFVCCCPSYEEDFIDTSEMDNKLFSSAMSIASDSTSDSGESTVPIAGRGAKGSETSLKEELATAKQEIDELKKLLAAKV
jgi:6-phosphogluconolactonase